MSEFAFKPNHDEEARQAFVGSLKTFINFEVERRLEERFDQTLAPAHAETTGRAPANRNEAAALLGPDPLFQVWASLTYHSQNLMWNSVLTTSRRTVDDQIALFRQLADNPGKLGNISLQDSLVVPPPISTTEIHRQPGGYWRETRDDDIETALAYTGTVDLYRNAKGMGRGGKVGSDSIGQMVAAMVRKYAPDLQPKSILDMGCGTGEQTLAYKRVFPDADVTGIDVARPFIRFAHGYAESQGLALDFREMDAAQTDFPDASFDLIVSIIMFHETSVAQTRRILKECRRLLKPGGLALHLDVPYQPHRTPLLRQVTNDWQVRYNGEPFWTGFAEMDMKTELIDAGFSEDEALAVYETAGPATFYFFGGRKSR